MDYQGIGMITVFLILVTLFVMSITSKTSGYKYQTALGSRIDSSKRFGVIADSKKYYKSDGKKYYKSGGIKLRIK